MLLIPRKCCIFKNIYLFLCLKVIFDTLGSYWLKNSSDFGKVQFCPELSNFSRFYPILATGEDFSTIVRLFYKPWYYLRYAFKKKKSRIMRHCPIHLLPPPSLPWIGQRNIGHKNLDFNPLPPLCKWDMIIFF